MKRAQAAIEVVESSGDSKYEQRRTEILKAAAATFRGRGFAGSSMSMIADELGMHKSNLYYYFKTKEEILFACHEYFMHENLELLKSVRRSKGTNAEKLHMLISSFVHIMIDKLHSSALTQNVKAMSLEHEKIVVAWRDTFEKGIRAIVRDGIAKGEFREVNVKLVVFAILGSVNWIHRWHYDRGSSNSDEIALAFADFHLAGLLAGKPKSPRTSYARLTRPFSRV